MLAQPEFVIFIRMCPDMTLSTSGLVQVSEPAGESGAHRQHLHAPDRAGQAVRSQCTAYQQRFPAHGSLEPATAARCQAADAACYCAALYILVSEQALMQLWAACLAS